MRKSVMMKLLILLFMVILVPAGLFAEQLKKVAILDIINIDKKTSFQYLESSITEAIAKMLTDRYAFRRMQKERLDEITGVNFLYHEDFYTKSVAMNIGLLGSQDVVISGGFRVDDANPNKISIQTEIRIFDIAKKKAIADFSMKGPADDRIWDTIASISGRIVNEMKPVLPNKDEWKKKEGSGDDESKPLFSNLSFGIRSGGFMYTNGWAKYFKPEQPIFGLFARWNIPVLWSRLGMQPEFYFFRHSLKPGHGTMIQNENLTGVTDNYAMGGVLFLEFEPSRLFIIRPQLGGGRITQTTTVTGKVNSNFSNSVPFTSGGLEFAYMINKTVSLALTARTFMEIEKNIITYAHTITAGVDFKL